MTGAAQTPRAVALATTGRRAAVAWAIAAVIGAAALSAPVDSDAATAEPAATAADRPRVGLVLSGGGARGGAHLGVLKVLHDLRVPVDVVVGTSAGSIVGAAFATGMPLAEIEAQMRSIRTADLVRDAVRPEIPLRRKSDDGTNFLGPEIGLGPRGWALPKAAVAGVALEALLRRLTVGQNDSDFDRLALPFRAIATDIATGEMVVLRQGSLSTAIRASMAIPAAVNPVEIDGRLLVDGGLARNLPVDVARALGAQVVIAVNIGTPLLNRSEITSLLSVSSQMTGLLTAANVQQSLRELTDRDVLITPDLSQVSWTDFEQLAAASSAGERAARDATERLRVLGVAPEHYAQWVARRASGGPVAAARSTPIAEVRIEGVERVHPAVVRATMELRPGRPYATAMAEGDMRRLYATGDFEGVSYHLDTVPGTGDVLTVKLDEKDWGPQYIRVGLGLSTDFRGDASFQLSASHRWTWLNAFGAEWRNDLRLGRENGLRTEFHQPLGPSQRLFAAAHAETSRVPFDLFVDQQRIARFRQARSSAGADLGAPLDTVGEVRAGLRRGRVSYGDDTGLFAAAVVLPAAELAGALLDLRLDTFDSLRFPRHGEAGMLQVYRSLTGLGASDAYTKVVAEVRAARSWGPNTIRLAAEVARSGTAAPLPDYELYSLGGFLRLSAYRPGELLGRNYRFGRVIYGRRLATPGVFDGASLGTSVEVGRIGNRLTGSVVESGLRTSVGVHVAVDTPLGPVYLGVARGDGGRGAVTLFIGPP